MNVKVQNEVACDEINIVRWRWVAPRARLQVGGAARGVGMFAVVSSSIMKHRNCQKTKSDPNTCRAFPLASPSLHQPPEPWSCNDFHKHTNTAGDARFPCDSPPHPPPPPALIRWWSACREMWIFSIRPWRQRESGTLQVPRFIYYNRCSNRQTSTGVQH